MTKATPKKTKPAKTSTTKTGKSAGGASTTTSAGTGKGGSGSASSSTNHSYKDVSRTLIVCLFDIFGDDTFRDAFDTGNFNRNESLRWIRKSTLPAAVRIVQLLSSKVEKRGKHANHSTIEDPDDPVMEELGTRQVLQTFQSALALHSYAVLDERVGQAFKITFLNRQCSLAFLNAGGFVQRVLKPQDWKPKTEPPMAFTRKPTIFEILLWFHCINMASDMVKNKELDLRFHYRNGNIIGYIVHRVCLAWGRLVQRIGEGQLSTHVLPYLWYNDKTGCFECLERENGFSSSSQLESLVPSVRPMKTGTGIDATAAGRDRNMDHAMRHVAHSLLFKLKKLACDTTIHALSSDQDVVDYPPIRALTRADDDNGLPYVFAEMDDEAMEVLGIAKPVPPPIEVINVEDGRASQVGRVTKIPATIHDPTLRFGAMSLNQHRSRKHTMETAPSTRPRKQRRTQAGDSGAGPSTVVKEEPELFVPVEPAQSEEFDEETQNAFDTLLKAMGRGVCVAYNVPFDDLAEAHSGGCGEELEEKVQLFFTDSPWNYRREHNMDNSDHDVLSDKDMKNVVELVATVLAKGGHAIIFCSAFQFRRWVQLFSAKKVKVQEMNPDDPDNPDNEVTVTRSVFNVEPNPLYFQRAPGFYNTTPNVLRMTHITTTEQAVHVWKSANSAAENYARVDFNRGGFVPSRHKGYTDCIDNIQRLTPHEKVCTDKLSENGRPKMLRPEQKSMALLQQIISKYTQPGDIVFDPFAGSYATGRACMSLPLHRRCIMGDKDPNCGKFAMRQLVEVYARQLLSDESDIEESDALKKVADTYAHQMDKINAMKDMAVWDIPKGYTPMTSFPPTLVNFISSTFQDVSLFNLYRNRPLIEWPLLWRARFHQMDVNTLLGFELAANNLEMKPSTIPNAGNGIFTTVRIPPDTVIGYYYGSLVYDNMSVNQSRRPTTYGEGHLQFEVKDFVKWALQLKTTAPNGESVWIFPAPFCAMKMINDARYREDEVGRPTREEIEANPYHHRYNNVKYNDVSHRQSMSDYRSYGLVEVRSLKHVIPAGNELFVDYGSNYDAFDS